MREPAPLGRGEAPAAYISHISATSLARLSDGTAARHKRCRRARLTGGHGPPLRRTCWARLGCENESGGRLFLLGGGSRLWVGFVGWGPETPQGARQRGRRPREAPMSPPERPHRNPREAAEAAQRGPSEPPREPPGEPPERGLRGPSEPPPPERPQRGLREAPVNPTPSPPERPQRSLREAPLFRGRRVGPSGKWFRGRAILSYVVGRGGLISSGGSMGHGGGHGFTNSVLRPIPPHKPAPPFVCV